MLPTTQLSPTSVGISLEFLRRRAPELARDIVCGVDGAARLAASYGLSENQWMVLKVWPAFVRLMQETNEELGGSAGTIERARRRAALAVAEFVVQDMATISGSDKATARDRIAAANLLVEIGAVSAKQQQAAAAAGTAFGGALIQIVMPNGAQFSIAQASIEQRPENIIEGQFSELSQSLPEDQS